jgi:TIGR03009 family protein
MFRSRFLTLAVVSGWIVMGNTPPLAAQAPAAGRPAAARAQAAAPAAPSPDPARMQQILQDWEGQSAKLKWLEVDIYRIDKDEAWEDEEHYAGHAAFETPQLAHLDFRKVKMQVEPDPKNKKKQIIKPVTKNGKIVSAPHETILCTAKNEVWHYRYDAKQITIFPLDKDQRKRALEEGPLPFLFNMKAAEANVRYEMTLHSEDNQSYTVKVKPRLKEDQDSFSTAWIILNRTFLLPTRIFLISPDKKSSKDFRLSHIDANSKKGVDPRLFVGVVPPKWKVERNPSVGNPQAAQRPPRGAPAR